MAQEGKTLQVNAYGINMDFVSNRSKIKSTELATNVLRIVNNTNKAMELNLQINPPAGWKSFGSMQKRISIKPKDSIFYPVRVRPFSEIKGNTNYVVNAFLSSDEFTITNTMWYISVEKISHWSVYTPETKVYFSGESDTTNFDISISNSGNSDEALQLAIFPDKEIDIITQSNQSALNTFPIFLKSGQDTTLSFQIRQIPSESLPVDYSGTPKKYDDRKVYRMKIKVTNERNAGKGTIKLWSGNIDFIKLPNKTKIKDAAVESIPMTIDFNTYDMLSQSTYSSLNIFGTKNFKNNSTLNYYYQSDFVKNQIDINSYLGNYIYLGYFHRKFSLEVGDIGTSRPGSTLNGKGIKGGLILGNHRFGGIFIRKPKLFDHFYAQGYGGYYTYKSKRIFADNYYQYINNDWRKVKSQFATTDWNIQLSRTQMLRIGGGYAIENHFWNANNPLDAKGYGLKIGYSGNFKKLSLTANSYYGSKNYSPMRGTFSINGAARYRLNNSYTLSTSAYHFKFNPNIYTFGKLTSDSLYNIQDNYSLKLNYKVDQNLFIFEPKYYTINSNPIASRTAGVAFEYRRLSHNAFKFYVNSFAGYTRFQRIPEMKDIFVSYIQSSIRYKTFQFNTRYYYGPYYTIEQVDYVRNEINPQKVYSTLYYDYWFLNNRMKLNLNLNYFYTTIHTRNQLITRPELFYYAPNGFRFNLYARYMFYGEGSYTRKMYNAGSGNYTEEIVPESTSNRFEIGAGVKFNINMPTGLKRYYKIKVVAFRDLNGNGKMDPNEKGIKNMLIFLKKNDTVAQINEPGQDFNTIEKTYELVSNDKGSVEYDYIPMGEYVITARPLKSMGGWFDGKTFYTTIDRNKTVFIPLSKGARISGGILTEKAKFSNDKKVNLGNIRVTAINIENGKTFSTLSDHNGQFVLFAPNGTYNIMINESAISSRYEFLQSSIPLKVTKDFENYNVSFYLTEKERTIRMGKGSSRPKLPIKRSSDSTPKPNTGSIKVEKTDSLGELPLQMVVSEIQNDSTAFVIQLFPTDRPLENDTTFKSMSGIGQVQCIKGKSGGYLYITGDYKKKLKAKRILKKIKKAGFNEAIIVNKVF